MCREKGIEGDLKVEVKKFVDVYSAEHFFMVSDVEFPLFESMISVDFVHGNFGIDVGVVVDNLHYFVGKSLHPLRPLSVANENKIEF